MVGKAGKAILELLSEVTGEAPGPLDGIYAFSWREEDCFVWFSGRGRELLARFSVMVITDAPPTPELFHYVATNANAGSRGTLVADDEADLVDVRVSLREHAVEVTSESLAESLDLMVEFAQEARSDLLADGFAHGWTDLAVTFANAGLAAPPVPEAMRARVLRLYEWCWSTRADIDPIEMYLFGRYIDEALAADTLPDYCAVSHAGHGMNSYGLNLNVVDGAIAVFTQHGWGGVYTDAVDANAGIAYTYAFLDQMLSCLDRDRLPDRLSYVLCLSNFRMVNCILERDPAASTSEADSWPSAAGWRTRHFDSELPLLAHAARELCRDLPSWFEASVRGAEERTTN